VTSAFGGQHSIQLSYGRVVRGRNDKGSDHGKASPKISPASRELAQRSPFPAPSAVARPVSPSHAMACTVAGRVSAIGAREMSPRLGLHLQLYD
jgi:hypothetical protein